MEYLQFNVAYHPFVIIAPQPGAVFARMPSYHPFFVEGALHEKPVFTLELTAHEVTAEVPFYTSFDWDEASCKVYRNEKNYAFEILPDKKSEGFVMTCDAGFARAQLQVRTEHPAFSFVLGNYLMMLYMLTTAPQDTLLMHASVIRHQGKGYLFQGKSGTGKSTHSALWLKHIPETELLNDDNPVIRILDGEARVFGSPWSGKTPCYRNESVPVGAFVRLSQAPENQISRQGVAQAFASLLPSCSTMKWDKPVNDAVCHTVGKLAVETPVYYLCCLPNEEAARLSHRTVTQP